MPVFKRLIQNPSSPDKDLKVLSGADRYKQSTFARLADVNALSKDVNDQKLYSLSATGATGSQAITTKKGVVKVTNSALSAATFTLTLTNSELVTTSDYFIQVSVGSATTMVPSVKIIPVTAGQFGILVTTTASINWATNPTYISYQIAKIGD
mgnify:CR=1 FL=1